ncbi:putative chromatin regulator PHD family [Rosa chinensis]|uniref:Putative chromatin regulator PHD family n=1 Tax=Rosa chinensis TaxID=74649 RepID=A0A2P6P1M7_ROSCH|nr:zinc finger protein SHOOT GRAVITROPISM 5 [Rosa chinensis]PRQ15835.1 putative chromatin regulator PHD family [Rosa chinensis]
MLANNSSSSVPCSEPFSCLENGNNNKRKRRPAGTPDPDAEVVSLSPKTLLESDRYVCEICNQGFQRDQNLQMHRRRHKVPWKLLKRETPVVRKRVFVCPEPSCLHHDPCHALGDLVGIKKHFRRKHSNHKQWVCEKCSKGYAVQSDYKAHLKTCGTRGHSCDCGRVFSRVESFIEHQDACNMDRLRPESQAVVLQPPACLSRTASSPSPSSETNFSSRTTPNWPSASALVVPKPLHDNTKLILSSPPAGHGISDRNRNSSKNINANSLYNLDLQLATTSNDNNPNHIEVSVSSSKRDVENHSTQLQLSIGSCDNFGDHHHPKNINIESNRNSPRESSTSTNEHHHQQMKPAGESASTSRIIKEEAREQLRLALAEKAYAEEARQQAEQQIELAEQEFANAKRIRQQAQAELDKAQALKEHAVKKINSTILQITCQACKQQFQARTRQANPHENSLAFSYMSSALTTTTSEGGQLEINASATRTDDRANSSAKP